MCLRRGSAALGASLLAVGAAAASLGERVASCPGSVSVAGHGRASLVIGSSGAADGRSGRVLIDNSTAIVAELGSRAYFATSCASGKYDPALYMQSSLLGKTMRFSVDLRGAGCGCDVMVYLTAMGHRESSIACPDGYCDANRACGDACAEIDIMEANRYAWHSTLHSAYDENGATAGLGGGGPGWTGPRDWTSDQYGPFASCIDTTGPFQVAVSFPVDDAGELSAMLVVLTQEGKFCPLRASVSNYAGMSELSQALSKGMTPVLSYWAGNATDWLDGKGSDGKGVCGDQHPRTCSGSVQLSDFAIEEFDGPDEQQAANDVPKEHREDFAWLMDSPGAGGRGGWMTSPYSRAEGQQVWVPDLLEEAEQDQTSTGSKAWRVDELLEGKDDGGNTETIMHFELVPEAFKEAVSGPPSSQLAAAACGLLAAAYVVLAAMGLCLRRSPESEAALGVRSPQLLHAVDEQEVDSVP